MRIQKIESRQNLNTQPLYSTKFNEDNKLYDWKPPYECHNPLTIPAFSFILWPAWQAGLSFSHISKQTPHGFNFQKIQSIEEKIKSVFNFLVIVGCVRNRSFPKINALK